MTLYLNIFGSFSITKSLENLSMDLGHDLMLATTDLHNPRFNVTTIIADNNST